MLFVGSIRLEEQFHLECAEEVPRPRVTSGGKGLRGCIRPIWGLRYIDRTDLIPINRQNTHTVLKLDQHATHRQISECLPLEALSCDAYSDSPVDNASDAP